MHITDRNTRSNHSTYQPGAGLETMPVWEQVSATVIPMHYNNHAHARVLGWAPGYDLSFLLRQTSRNSQAGSGVGFLPPEWETQTALTALAWSWSLQVFGKRNRGGEFCLSLLPSVSLPASQPQPPKAAAAEKETPPQREQFAHLGLQTPSQSKHQTCESS